MTWTTLLARSRALRTAALCALAVLYGAALASPQAMQEMIRKMYGTPAKLDAAIYKAYGAALPPEQMRVARQHMQAILFHPRMGDFIWKIAEPLSRAGMDERQLAEVMQEIILDAQAKGLARLPPDRQLVFVRHMSGLMGGITPAQCRAMGLGTLPLSETAAFERRYIASLPPAKFAQAAGIYREAVEAQLNESPEPRSVNSVQATSAEKVYEEAAANLLRRRFTLEQLTRLSADPFNGTDVETCTMMKSYIDAMVEMPQPFRDWKVTGFVSSLQ